ncbi:profilin (plasmid) [Streptomyces sp. NBC_01426]|uniref:profilin n=1 Tax=Streptomyces sp. NBC_01426 TaxID=2975866 RepID=UPI002E302B29|nr:profilin [Streptomyces sp. NBC_01426]
MSWQDFVDNDLVGTGKVRQGAIIGFDGNMWAASPNFRFLAGEGAAIVKLCNTPENYLAGVTVVGVRYLGAKGDTRSVVARKSATGVILAKTKQAVVIGRYDESQNPGEAQLTVEKLADYLIANGT